MRRSTVAIIAGAAAAVVGVWPGSGFGQAVENTSYRDADGRRVLRQSVVVEAPVDSAWRAFTTSEGLRSFVAPVAAIDLEVGGRWEASYDRDARIGDPGNIVNEILAYLPGEMLSIRVRRAPPDFPFPEEVKELWTVIQFDEAGPERTRVTETMLGWEEGRAWDALYAAFERDNATVFRRLRERFRTGPVDWEEAAPEGRKGRG